MLAGLFVVDRFKAKFCVGFLTPDELCGKERRRS